MRRRHRVWMRVNTTPCNDVVIMATCQTALQPQQEPLECLPPSKTPDTQYVMDVRLRWQFLFLTTIWHVLRSSHTGSERQRRGEGVHLSAYRCHFPPDACDPNH